MQAPLSVLELATPGGLLLVLAIMLPFAGVFAMLALGGRRAEWVALAVMPAGLGIALAIVDGVVRRGDALHYVLGGWAPPLGVALRADGIAAAMLGTTALVICATAGFAGSELRTPRGASETRQPFAFWTLLLAVWGALNTVFLAGDLFTLYVALELLTFAAVPLVCLGGQAEQLEAALRYLLFALIGSMLYLLGAVLLYGAWGTLDIPLLASRIRPDAATHVAVALMSVGLLAKTALFPLHLWLPPAHAGAPAAASAVLSGLVVKGSFFLLVRLWFDVLPGAPAGAAPQLLAALGAAAIGFGSVVALRQARLKLLVAYSTVAQIGYLFLMFPLVAESGTAGSAWTGGWLQVISHAFAKAAMFMAAGLIAEALGHDRIAEFRGIGRALPTSVFAFGLGGLSLMGLPPSGGFVAKWRLLTAAIELGQWWWALVVLAGGMLTGGYVFRVLSRALAGAADPQRTCAPVARHREIWVLVLALLSVLLGVLPLGSSGLFQLGRMAAPGAALP